MPHSPITLRRAELYEEVWAEPVRTVAKRYGVSDVALAKMCRKHAIPVPERGHWTRVEFGQKPERPPLPPLPDGMTEEWSVQRGASGEPTIQDLAREAAKSAARPAPQIIVRPTLDDPHQLVASAQAKLTRAKPDAHGNVFCSSSPCLDISVAPTSLDRALRIMDALARACEARGLPFEVTKEPIVDQHDWQYGQRRPPAHFTRVQVAGEWIRLRLFEHYVVVRDPPPPPPAKLTGSDRDSWLRWNQPTPRREPNGKMELAISSEGEGAIY